MGQNDHGAREARVSRQIRRLCLDIFKAHRPTPGQYDISKPIGYELRPRNDSHMSSQRLVIYLRGTMCEWNIKSGGCVYCGFYRATNGGRRVERKHLLSQIEAAHSTFSSHNGNAVGLYNDGSFFNDREIDEATQMDILRRVSRWHGVHQITVESRAEYLTPDKLAKARNAADPCILEVATGIDSVNQTILNIASNRGLNIRTALSRLSHAQELGVRTTALMTFGLPFLSVSEMIADAVHTIECMLEHGIAVDIEAMTIQPGSLLERLNMRGYYRVPWLWSLVELFQRIPDANDVYLSPFAYSVATTDVPHNCPTCTGKVAKQLFGTFANTRSKTDLPNIEPCCGPRWRDSLELCPETTLLDRAETIIGRLSCSSGLDDHHERNFSKGGSPCAGLQG